jgi:hypothetical protein
MNEKSQKMDENSCYSLLNEWKPIFDIDIIRMIIIQMTMYRKKKGELG